MKKIFRFWIARNEIFRHSVISDVKPKILLSKIQKVKHWGIKGNKGNMFLIEDGHSLANRINMIEFENLLFGKSLVQDDGPKEILVMPVEKETKRKIEKSEEYMEGYRQALLDILEGR